MTLLALSAASWIGLSVVVALAFGVVIRTVDRQEAALRAQHPADAHQALDLAAQLTLVAGEPPTAATDAPLLPAQPSRATRLTVVA